jgi:hypothetical protein
MRARLLCGVVLAGASIAPPAWATATFTITVVDDDGVGFNDKTPATPIAGNDGTTVGQQRLNVFQAAADAWGRILESSVPIEVQASFAPLDCINGMAVEGHAGPYSVKNYPSLPTTGEYPTALANKILGKDLFPTHPDITAEFNSDLASCIGKDWYYGLDGSSSKTQANLLTTVIHELGHGLGFTADLDMSTGAFANGVASIFASHMLDNKTRKHFSDMTDAERKTALTDVRQLVWDGPRTDAVAARFLAKGRPSLQISPAPSGFSGAIGEANFGRYLADLSSVSGGVAAGTLPSGCTSSTTSSFSGKVALVVSTANCSPLLPAYMAEKSGALAVLFAYSQTANPPPRALEVRSADLASYSVTIPTLAVTLDDANLIKNASGVTATLSADKTKSVGTDDAGHALLFASNPIQSGSTGSHWDPIVRPNLTMEPVEPPNPILYLDMERAVLWDIGWTGNCGNGTVDGEEACDEGTSNSDYFPDACRLDCTKAKCGDGVVDSGEQCDPGGNGKLGNASCDSSCHLKSGGTGGASGTGGSGKGGENGSGGSSSRGGAGGSGAGGSGGTAQGGSGGGSSGRGGNGGSTGGAGGTGPGDKGSGCSLHTGRGDLGPGVSMLAVGLALASALRRRRTRRG